MRIRRNAGFTLIELMIVIGILLVLMVALIPAIGMFQERSNRFACQANLGHLHRAAVTYSSEEGLNQTMPNGNGQNIMQNFLIYGFIENASQIVCPAAEHKPPRIKAIAEGGSTGGEAAEGDLWAEFFNKKISLVGYDTDSYSYKWSKTVRKNGDGKALAADREAYHGERMNVLYSNGRIEASKKGNQSIAGFTDLE